MKIYFDHQDKQIEILILDYYLITLLLKVITKGINYIV